MALTALARVSPAVASCFDIYRRGTAARPTEDEECAFIRLHADLALLSARETDDYYRLVRQLRMLVHLESERIEWP